MTSAGPTPAAPPPTDDDPRERMAFSSHGKTRYIVLRGDWGKRLDRHIVRWTGFSVITWQFAKAGGHRYQPTLLLTSIGCQTGALRSSALPYYRDGDDMVVVGSRGGSPRNPLWVGNILADPHCWLTIRRRRIPALARVATGAERERLYPLIAAQHPNLERYQERAAGFGREIPLVVLTRRD